jgi:opacity protein-like surface antigen
MRSVKPLLLPVVAVGLLLAAGPALAEMGGEVNLLLGQKNLSDDNLDDLESETGLDLATQFEYGITSSFGNVDWPVAIAVDLLLANSDDSYTYDGDGYLYRYTVDVDTTELNLGVRKYWKNNEKWQPYVGGGLAWVKAELKISYYEEFLVTKQETFSASESVDDSAIGYWLNGGVMWRFHDKMSLGLDLRYTDAEVEFDVSNLDKQTDTAKFDAGGFHYGLLFGYRW